MNTEFSPRRNSILRLAQSARQVKPALSTPQGPFLVLIEPEPSRSPQLDSGAGAWRIRAPASVLSHCYGRGRRCCRRGDRCPHHTGGAQDRRLHHSLARALDEHQAHLCTCVQLCRASVGQMGAAFCAEHRISLIQFVHSGKQGEWVVPLPKEPRGEAPRGGQQQLGNTQ